MKTRLKKRLKKRKTTWPVIRLLGRPMKGAV